MLFRLSCKAATHLVLERADRRLSVAERLALRQHMLICRYCPPFARQAALMRLAMQRWKQRAETGADDGGGEAGQG